MALTGSEIQVALAGHIYLAPAGTAYPAGTAAPGTTFAELGYSTDAGVKFTFDSNTQELPVWQSADPIRIIQVSRPREVAFTLRQFNPANVQAAFGGGSYSTNGTIGTYVFPAPSDSAPGKCLIIDWMDGTVFTRLEMDNMQQQGAIELDLVRTESVNLPIDLKSLAGTVLPQIISNAPSWLS